MPSEKWSITDGVLTSTGAAQLYSVRGDYNDFHLRAEVKCDATSNGGIYFRSNKPYREVGDYETQITGFRGDAQATGSLYNLVKIPQASNPVAADTWFVYEVIAEGDRIRLLVDDKETANYRETRPNSNTKAHLVLQHLLLDAATGKLDRSFPMPKDSQPNSVSFTPDGRHLLVGNVFGTVYVFRLAE